MPRELQNCLEVSVALEVAGWSQWPVVGWEFREIGRTLTLVLSRWEPLAAL